MGTNHNAIQSAVVLTVTVVCALLYGTLDAFICFAVHVVRLLQNGFGNSMAEKFVFNQKNSESPGTYQGILKEAGNPLLPNAEK